MLGGFLTRYNRKFAVPAVQPGSAYRRVGKGFVPARVFCFKYYRVVGADNVVRFGEHRMQIMPTNGRASYARVRVEVHEMLDGGVAVYYQGNCLVTKAAPSEAPMLRARNMPRVVPVTVNPVEVMVSGKSAKKRVKLKSSAKTKPSTGHPWRRPFKVHIDRGDKFTEQLG